MVVFLSLQADVKSFISLTHDQTFSDHLQQKFVRYKNTYQQIYIYFQFNCHDVSVYVYIHQVGPENPGQSMRYSLHNSAG